MSHNTPQNNADFKAAWDVTNQLYIANTKWAICETFKRRHESKHVRNACRDNIVFYRKMQKMGEV